MGCLVSKPPHRDKLDELEATMSSLTVREGDGELDIASSCAAKLKEIMQDIIQAGASDIAGLKRVEVLSETLLGNLEGRIDESFISKPNFDDVFKQMMAIAADLDAVRATKATTILEDRVKKLRERMAAQLEAKAKAPLAQISKLLAELKEPAQLMPAAGSILNIAAQVHEQIPTSKKVTDSLLRALVDLAKKILQFHAAWATEPARATAVKEIATKLDELAQKLVVVMGSTWDPTMLPQVERLALEGARQRLKDSIKGAETEIANRKCAKAFEYLVALKPAWPALKDDASAGLQVVGIFSKLQTLACQDFINLSKAGQTAVAGQIREFATKFDTLREQFEGLPPPAGGLLKDSLDAGEVKATAEKQIAFIVNELRKPVSGEKEMSAFFSKMVQGLEGLVPIWEQIAEKEADTVAKFSEVVEALEGQIEKLAIAAQSKAITEVLTFAEEYDQRRSKLVPPEPPKGALQPRIALTVVDTHLEVVDAELAKVDGLNPVLLLDNFKAAASSLPSGEPGETHRERMRAAMEKTTERMLKSFNEAVAAGQARKEEMLLKFASGFDEAFQKADLLAPGVESLTQRMNNKHVEDAKGALTSLEAALSSGDVLGCLAPLKLVQSKWTLVAESPELKAQAEQALKQLPSALEGASKKGSAAEAGKLLELAGELDLCLPPSDGPMAQTPLKPTLLGTLLKDRLTSLEGLLADLSTVDGAKVKAEVESVTDLLKGSTESDEHTARFGALRPKLEQHLIQRILTAVSPTEALDVAEDLDLSAAAGEGADAAAGSSLKQSLTALRATYEPLAAARTELAKAAGFDPRVVLKTLKLLPGLWSSLSCAPELKTAAAAPVGSAVKEIAEGLKGKLMEASTKAVDSGVEVPKKTQALVDLATDGTKQQELLLSTPLEGFEVVNLTEAVTAHVGAEALRHLQQELDKDTGLDPGKVLKNTEVCTHWGAKLENPGSLPTDFQSAVDRVHTRMIQSMAEAKEAANEKKQMMLLDFATKFDAASKPMIPAPGLRAAMEAKQKE